MDYFTEMVGKTEDERCKAKVLQVLAELRACVEARRMMVKRPTRRAECTRLLAIIDECMEALQCAT